MDEDNKEKPKTMMEMFPAAELARAMLHIDRFDTHVVTEERVAAEKSLDKLEEFSEKVIQDDM